MTQGMEDQVLTSALTDTGSILTAECPRADMAVARAVLEQLYYADRKTNWSVDMKGGTIIITCDRKPEYGYTMPVSRLGKGYTGKNLIRHIGCELIERIEAGVC